MAVNLPRGISKAELKAPDLGDLLPIPPAPSPLPIPYPNTAHFTAPPATQVINGLFGHTEIDVLGTASPSDFFIV